MFDHQLAEVYDLVYRRRGKDYRAEAAELAAAIRARRPGAASLLDVACGTGEHLAHLAEHFTEAEGLELSRGMLGVARAKLPHLTLHAADMCTFDLGRRFDAITCMFSSIGYLAERDRMHAAVARMAAHLTPGGVLVIEPWWSPERFIDKYVSGEAVSDAGVTVTRVSRTRRLDDAHAEMEVHFVVADSARIEHFSETHVLGLFSRAEHMAAFADAGCDAEFVEEGPSGPGLYVGVRTG
ncbi:class I SAM-dependent methyltransferase [Actinomadura hibisca]|uniref:PdmO n=1 Tax=Actinomadura hibisca TaxID=68565 RepID=A1YZ58_9ACTN|nr:class I SAM-dependent methyltransferase [Actinomadura hibisca]ABM21743.1 PdmO [Actinomadura hibisca]